MFFLINAQRREGQEHNRTWLNTQQIPSEAVSFHFKGVEVISRTQPGAAGNHSRVFAQVSY